MDKLRRAVSHLGTWRIANKGRTRARCLEALRGALAQEGLRLPQSWRDYDGNYAIDCFKALAKDPEKWGWERVSHPLPEYCLVFFKGCGWLPWRSAWAGHIAILHDGKHYANDNYRMTRYWGGKLVGAFHPKE